MADLPLTCSSLLSPHPSECFHLAAHLLPVTCGRKEKLFIICFMDPMAMLAIRHTAEQEALPLMYGAQALN